MYQIRLKMGNQSSIQACSRYDPIRATGLNGAYLDTIFPISGLIAWNPEYPILPGDNPACFNLSGFPIVVPCDLQYVEQSVELEKWPFLKGIGIFGIGGWRYRRGVD